MKLLVTLTDDQFVTASEAGFQRALDAIRSKRRDQHRVKSRDEKDHWGDHIEGAVAEMAVCTIYGFRFSGFQPTGITRLHDAGPLEVRYVKHKGYALLTYPKDLPHQRLVLCRVKGPRVLLEGWATSQEINDWGAKIVGNVKGLRPDQLRCMSTLGYDIIAPRQVDEWGTPD